MSNLAWIIPVVVAYIGTALALVGLFKARAQARMSKAAAQDFCRAAGDMGHIMGRYVVDERGQASLAASNDRMQSYMKKYADVVGK